VVQQGQSAPAFDLPSSDGGRVRLSDLKGRVVVLYFYPRDNTPGCTREACAFQAVERQLSRRGVVVLGVSPDSLESHAKFRGKYKLAFPLLADTDKSVARAYGAFGEKVLYGKKTMGIIRSTFIIDGAGVVRRVFPKVKVDGHVDEVIEALDELG
jgi:thioredoxin-dependent peroxiredoxin